MLPSTASLAQAHCPGSLPRCSLHQTPPCPWRHTGPGVGLSHTRLLTVLEVHSAGTSGCQSSGHAFAAPKLLLFSVPVRRGAGAAQPVEISAKPPRASSSLMGSPVWEGNGLMLVRLALVLGFVGVFGGVWILDGLWCSCPHCRDACGLLLSSPVGPMPGFFSGPLYLERLLLHTHERAWTFSLGSQADCPGFPPAPPCGEPVCGRCCQ